MYAKLIMQRMCKENLEWDESIPAEIHTEWNSYAPQLSALNNLEFDRRIIPSQCKDVQLHGFCDASEKAYGACVYIRAIDSPGNISTSLLCAKSHVAPLKREQERLSKPAISPEIVSVIDNIPSTTIPKLELCGAGLLAKLYATVRQVLNIKIDKTILWCDNTVVLNLINTPPYQLLTFVANRASFIQEKTHPGDWCHVRSLYNPADLISRGQQQSDYVSSFKWKN